MFHTNYESRKGRDLAGNPARRHKRTELEGVARGESVLYVTLSETRAELAGVAVGSDVSQHAV